MILEYTLEFEHIIIKDILDILIMIYYFLQIIIGFCMICDILKYVFVWQKYFTIWGGAPQVPERFRKNVEKYIDKYKNTFIINNQRKVKRKEEK